jgi:CDP-diacylglycerol---glycerol-3-phosphate 3-phosphatidyltransferase
LPHPPTSIAGAFELRLKPRFQTLLRRLARFLTENGAIANHTALAAVLLSFLVGAIIALQAQWPLLLMPLALSLRMGLNAAAEG